MTIKDIAEKLNLSISTVSKALNNATDISEDTRKLICDYAKEVGYKVKSKKQTRRICVMYEQNENDRYNVLHHVITAFSNMASLNGFEVVIESLSTKPQGFKLDEHLINNRFCAAFLVGMNFDSRIYKQFKKTTVPLVLLDNHIPDAPLISSVSSDNLSAIASAVKYLVKMGHSKIGFLSGEKQSMVCAERLAGYILGLARMGENVDSDYVYYGDFTKASGEAAAKFFNNTDVTAVVCCSDIMAIGLIDGLKELGKRVPEDISVIGFDDLDMLSFTNYGLTTMKQDFKALGESAYIQLTDMLSGRTPQRFVLPCKLIERSSVLQINATAE